MKLLKNHILALRQVRYGCDIMSYRLAGTLRDIQQRQATAPEPVLDICKAKGRYGPKVKHPYFGAVLTKAGMQFLRDYPRFRTPGTCRVCGCTDADCEICIEHTGEPCHWTDGEQTLCSACADTGDQDNA